MGCLAVKPQSRSGSWWYDSTVMCDETNFGVFQDFWLLSDLVTLNLLDPLLF